jgi:hypothetical protein
MVSKRRFKIVSSDRGKDGQEGTERGDDLGNKKFKNRPKECRSLQAGPYYEVVIALADTSPIRLSWATVSRP